MLTAASLKPISTGFGFGATFTTGWLCICASSAKLDSRKWSTAFKSCHLPGKQSNWNCGKKKKTIALWHSNPNSDCFILRNPHSFTTEPGKLSTHLPRLFLSEGDHVTQSPWSGTSCSLWEGSMPGAWQTSLRIAEHRKLLCPQWEVSLPQEPPHCPKFFFETKNLRSYCFSGFLSRSAKCTPN